MKCSKCRREVVADKVLEWSKNDVWGDGIVRPHRREDAPVRRLTKRCAICRVFKGIVGKA